MIPFVCLNNSKYLKPVARGGCENPRRPYNCQVDCLTNPYLVRPNRGQSCWSKPHLCYLQHPAAVLLVFKTCIAGHYQVFHAITPPVNHKIATEHCPFGLMIYLQKMVTIQFANSYLAGSVWKCPFKMSLLVSFLTLLLVLLKMVMFFNVDKKNGNFLWCGMSRYILNNTHDWEWFFYHTFLVIWGMVTLDFSIAANPQSPLAALDVSTGWTGRAVLGKIGRTSTSVKNHDQC